MRLLCSLLLLVAAHAARGDDLKAKLDQAVRRAGGDAFWGTVLVARGGRTLLSRGYGFADYKRRPNTPRTLFEIASTSKQFTAAAILKLRMEGKLKLSDPLANFFPGAPADKRGITLHQLLTHTSGISGNIGLPYASRATRHQLAAHVFAKPLVSRPGERWAYCNVAYALLAAVVEIASGQTFEAYSEAKLFGPAGMRDTGFVGDKDLDRARMTARRTKFNRPDWTAADWWWGWGYRGMGGVVSTAEDLLRWHRALKGDQILDRAAKQAFYKPYKQGYALGWFIATSPLGTTRISHGGGVMGYRAGFARYPEEDAVIVVLSNDTCDTHAVEQAFERLLFPIPPLEARLDWSPYRLTPGKAVQLAQAGWTVARQDGKLRLALRDTARGHDLATLLLPGARGKKLVADLRRALEAQPAEGKPGMQGGIYLSSYSPSGTTLQLREGLEIRLTPRYVGTGADGKQVVDERIVLVVQDEVRRQWPVMAHMSRSEAKALLGRLVKATEAR